MVKRRALKFMLICYFFVLSISILFSGCLCQSDSILTGQSLFQSQTIVSKNGRFEVGFFTPGNSSNYYFGIWYKNIPQRTVVWLANRNNPISNSLYNSSRLELSNGDLFLLVNGERTGITATSNATESVILDTGNFVLRNAVGIIIWESFDYPTNTWLPGRKLGFRVAKLVSWENPDNPATGKYSLGMEPNGGSELFLRRNNNSRNLWRSGVLQRGAFTYLPSQFGNFTYISTNDSFLVYNAFNESMMTRIVMDYVGTMMHYVWVDFIDTWDLISVQPPDACKSYALCGPNSICDMRTSPICTCLAGFVPRNAREWNLFNYSGGCVRENPLSCDGGDFRIVSNIRFDENPQWFRILVCESVCRANCSCSGYTYSREGGCLFFWGDFLDLERLSNGSAGQDLFVKMDSLSVGKGNAIAAGVIVLLSISAAVVVCGVLICCYCCRKRKSKGSYQDLLLLDLKSNGAGNNNIPTSVGSSTHGEEEDNKYELPTFSFSSVAAATKSFSIAMKLGEGGFGPVYKGELRDGQFVAVKRLSSGSGQGLEEFKNETELIAKLQHRNLVGILGCCIENNEKILVYEYMPNKSLDFFLFDSTRKEVLDWGRRVSIIEGIAQGLLYLHHYSRLRIIHRDLKASNILLDAEMNPKISDFGMARIFGGSDSQANTRRIVGTYGYMSPEYAMDGVFSIKSDVFAFGVLMLEIISGKKNTGFYASEHLTLLGYAWNLWTNNRGLELVDPSLEMFPSSSVIPLRYIQIGLLCVQENPVDRPMMLDVVAMLSKEQIPIASPQHPAFIIGRTLVHKSNPGENIVENCSVNDMTVSLMEAR